MHCDIPSGRNRTEKRQGGRHFVNQDHYTSRMLLVLQHIQRHLDDPMDLETLAGLCHYSPSHFHRVFKGMIGESLKEHIRRLRLERAAHRLLLTRMRVTEIALAAGYETPESFSRAFKTMFGHNPSGFRASFTYPLFPEAPSGIHYAPDNLSGGVKLNPQGEHLMDVRIKHMPEIQVVFVRHTGPYVECHPAWEALCAWAGPKRLIHDSTQFIGICYDSPCITAPENLRMDACMTVSGDIPAEGKVGVQIIGGFDCASHLYKGPYENLEQTYAEIFGKWLPQSGREAQGGPSYEVYLNSPDETAPEDLLTEIRIPLK